MSVHDSSTAVIYREQTSLLHDSQPPFPSNPIDSISESTRHLEVWIEGSNNRCEGTFTERHNDSGSEALANQVNAFVRTGRLSAEQAELLLIAADGLMDQP